MDDRAEVIPDFAASLTQITSDATRRAYEQGQTVTQTMSEWNNEVSHFVSRRVARNGGLREDDPRRDHARRGHRARVRPVQSLRRGIRRRTS